MMLFRYLLVLILALSVVAADITEQVSDIKTGPGSFQRYVLSAAGEPPVEYYLSKPDQSAPLVLFIQGSGCSPVFFPTQGGDHGSTVFSAIPTSLSGKFAVMVVSKPFAANRIGDGRMVNCPAVFNDYFTLETWVRHLQLALNHALAMPWVDGRRVLAFGTSEGANAAARLASQETRISHVALVGGTGTSQLYDFFVNAYASNPKPSDALVALQEIETTVKAIRAAPQSTRDFAWGHTYKRWTSFFAASPVDDLLKSGARIYLASGTADTSVPILSTEVLYSRLLAAGRDITFRRVAGADHALVPDGGNMADAEVEYQRIYAWFASQ